MILVSYIKKIERVHYYFTHIDGKTTVAEFKGPEGIMKHILVSNKCTCMLYLFEQFISIDKEITDPGKETFAYSEKVKRIKAYIDWGFDNQDIAAESVIDNGFISRKFMKAMIDSISPEHPSKKELIMLHYNVTLLYKAPYNI